MIVCGDPIVLIIHGGPIIVVCDPLLVYPFALSVQFVGPN